MQFGPDPCSHRFSRSHFILQRVIFFQNCPKISDFKKIFKLINVLCLLPQRMQTLPTSVCLVEVGFEWTVWLRFKFQWRNISKFTCRISQTEKFFHLVCQRIGSSGEPWRQGNIYWPLFIPCTVRLTAGWRRCSVTWPDVQKFALQLLWAAELNAGANGKGLTPPRWKLVKTV